MNEGSFEKWLILGLEQGKYDMSLEHLVVPGGEEVPQIKGKEACQRETGTSLKELPMAKAATI